MLKLRFATLQSSKRAILALALLVTAALPLTAHAQTAQSGPDPYPAYVAVMVKANGMMVTREITPEMATQMMKGAKPVTNMMIIMHEGKAWMVQDAMVSGSMTNFLNPYAGK